VSVCLSVLCVYKFKARFVIDIVYYIYQTTRAQRKKMRVELRVLGRTLNWPEEKIFPSMPKGPAEGGKKQKRREREAARAIS